MSLQACKASYAVGGRRLIERFELAVEPGEILMLAGNNGAGKSTLLSLLAGCPTPDEGEVRLESRALTAWPASALAARRAILPQSPSLAFDFPVCEVVRLGALPHAASSGEIAEGVLEVLRWMDLDVLAQRGYFSLSGGERQRVHLARVLLQVRLAREAPCYLLLDEPLAALDLAHQYALMRRLRRLVSIRDESGGARLGVVLVTHDLNVAWRYADRVCLLKAGCRYAVGATAEVMTAGNIRAVFGVDAEVTERAVVTRPLPSDDA